MAAPLRGRRGSQPGNRWVPARGRPSGGAPPGASRIATHRAGPHRPRLHAWRRPSGGVEDRNLKWNASQLEQAEVAAPLRGRRGSQLPAAPEEVAIGLVAAPLRGRRGSQPADGRHGATQGDRWRRPSGGVEDRNNWILTMTTRTWVSGGAPPGASRIATGPRCWIRTAKSWRRPSGGVEDRNFSDEDVVEVSPLVAAPLRGRRGSQPGHGLTHVRRPRRGGAPPGASRIATPPCPASRSACPSWRRPSGGVEDRNQVETAPGVFVPVRGGAPPGASRIATRPRPQPCRR